MLWGSPPSSVVKMNSRSEEDQSETQLLPRRTAKSPLPPPPSSSPITSSSSNDLSCTQGPHMEILVKDSVAEGIGVLFICLMVQKIQAETPYPTQGLVLALSTALVTGLVHYNFPDGVFHPLLLIYKYLYAACHARFDSVKNATASLFMMSILILMGLAGSVVATMATWYQFNKDYGRVGVPTINPSVSDNSIMVNMFIASFIFFLTYQWQMLRGEECNRTRTHTDDHHSLHMEQVAHSCAIGVAYGLATLYSFSVSGGGINLYATFVPAWMSGNGHGVAQEMYGQLMGIGASSLCIFISCMAQKRFKFAQA
jgi:hypothetical protein